MSEIVYYLNKAEAEAHGKIEKVVRLLRVRRKKSDIGELVYDDDPNQRELVEDEAAEVEKTYYKVVLP